MISCNSYEPSNSEEKVKKDTSIRGQLVIKEITPKDYESFSNNPGDVGVYHVPEMLTLCVHDSASMDNISIAFAKAYKILDEELKTLKLKSNGAPGSIYFSNNPNKIVFECVYPIEKKSEIQPKKSKVVALKECNMFIYNYYGIYGDLYLAYDEIRKKIKENGLEQNGPMREFYVTDPSHEKDSSKWLTRIMIPVQNQNSRH